METQRAYIVAISIHSYIRAYYIRQTSTHTLGHTSDIEHTLVFLSLVNHVLDLLGRQTTLVTLEHTLLDGQERDIEGSSTEIEKEHIALADHLLVETICDR